MYSGHRARISILSFLTVAILVYSPTWVESEEYFYDPLGQLIGVQGGSENLTLYTYDPAGNLLKVESFPQGVGVGVRVLEIAPSRASVGALIEIRGVGFSAVASENTVQFNGSAATVVSSTKTAIRVTVPAGAASGPVTVTSPKGNGVSQRPFTLLVPAVITGIEPRLVPQGTKNRLIITGSNLDSVTTVDFPRPDLAALVHRLGTTGTTLIIELNVDANVPLGSYSFSVANPAGVTQSQTVAVIVGKPVPSLNAAQAMSVFKAAPPIIAPSENSVTSAPAVSVGKP